MNYYDDAKNVASYIKMAEGYDGTALVQVLTQYLPVGSAVLELGMGPGKDLALLAQHYVVTGSDRSPMFLDRYRADHPDADLLQLDAATLATERRFDGIYSNKVLYHLTVDELRHSFARQAAVLNPQGIALHSFWRGEGEENLHGLHFVYYDVEGLCDLASPAFDILEASLYGEAEEDDSICLVLQRRGAESRQTLSTGVA